GFTPVRCSICHWFTMTDAWQL
ncbi:MAG: hypothetical protein EOP18_04745, partial [Rhizobiaceae bacterium]